LPIVIVACLLRFPVAHNWASTDLAVSNVAVSLPTPGFVSAARACIERRRARSNNPVFVVASCFKFRITSKWASHIRLLAPSCIGLGLFTLVSCTWALTTTIGDRCASGNIPHFVVTCFLAYPVASYWARTALAVARIVFSHSALCFARGARTAV